MGRMQVKDAESTKRVLSMADDQSKLILTETLGSGVAVIEVAGSSYSAYASIVLDKESAVILGERLIEFGSQP
ncbi:hypothetical protein L3Y21_gp087 [Gordonia phage Rabbitrun]|uniref:Uncharacterized protein n=1 Tax=Gordonia phage Rabbitrun TaxID=2762280 RepID=A0A7G8LIQ6_9CAUD|nr:hypothetical protein L3Y21_gp087 [Gordonia phage Rabbitrun]QNJ57128.1 hypothetical protein SEA_RABBITRUN_87 [Gordonia phage Rabbitrun]